MTTSEIVADTSIIVAVNGSSDTARAVRWGSRLARLQGRDLVLADTGPTQSAEVRLRAAAELTSDLQVTTVVVPDLTMPTTALAALASPHALLVVGAHRSSPLRHGYKRPTPDSVARHARCPVVVVHPDERPGAHHGVVVGIVGDQQSAASLRFAYDYASWTGAPLTVLHCFWDVTHEPGLIQDLATAPNEHRQLAESVAGLRDDYPDVQVQLELANGFPEHLIVEAGRSADMVVIGSDHKGWFRELVEGSVPRWVMVRSECDVALVPEAGDTS